MLFLSPPPQRQLNLRIFLILAMYLQKLVPNHSPENYPHHRAATGDKTSKTKVLPGFCEIECNGISASAPLMWQSCLPKICCDRPNEKMVKTVIWHLILQIWAWIEKFSEIKPPLTFPAQRYARILRGHKGVLSTGKSWNAWHTRNTWNYGSQREAWVPWKTWIQGKIIFIRDPPFKTSATFQDFWPLSPYHRHSSKKLMKGIFDPHVLWPFDHWNMGTPLPP